MELKTKKQYTYLIYPYVVDEKKYDDYLLKLLKDKRIKLKIWNKENDLNIYTYFLPEIREKLFWQFSYNREKIKQLNEVNNEFRAKILSKYEMTTFEYCLDTKIQAKIGDNNIFLFDVDKIEIICFKTGICFILLKTSLGKEIDISDVLEFNNKFRTIYSNFITMEDEKIKVQTDNLKEITDLYSIVKNIIGTYKDAKDLKILEERILPYTYICLNEDKWNNEFNQNLKESFIKIYKVLLNDEKDVNIDNYNDEIIELSEFLKVGFSKQGTGIISSNIKPENSLKTPYIFEQEYLYTYILALYKDLYLNKLSGEYQKTKKFDKIKEKLERFSLDIWIKPVTKEKRGLMLNTKWEDTLQIQYKYEKLKIDMTLKK